MSKVWIVTSGDTLDWGIRGVYSAKEAAQRHADQIASDPRNGWFSPGPWEYALDEGPGMDVDVQEEGE